MELTLADKEKVSGVDEYTGDIQYHIETILPLGFRR
jgi:hypothetical protein